MYDALTQAPVLHSVDGMLFDYQSTLSCPFKHYCWNYREPNYIFRGYKGLVYQDKTYASTIQGVK